MNRKYYTLLCAFVVLFCVAIVSASAVFLLHVIPEKKQATVSTLETNSIFQSELPAVQPEREELYTGELTAPVETEQPQTPDEPQQPDVPDPAQTLAEQTLAVMGEDEKIWQLFFLTPESLTNYAKVTEAGLATKEALQYRPVGGLIYFSQNLVDREQTTRMLTTVQTMSRIPLFLGVDEEGGSVSRVGANEALGGVTIDAMSAYGEKGDPAALYGDMESLAESLRGLGFNMNFAPVADVAAGKNAVIADRSFGTDPELCASLVPVVVTALQNNGIQGCLKHFPGYGSASADTHNASAFTDRTLEQLEAADFLPFAAGVEAEASFVMVSHLSVPNVVGDETPADLSKTVVTDLLRNKLGFSNIIITDAQNMAAITDHYTAAEAAVKALQAGADMILMPADARAAYDGVKSALQNGTLSWQRIDESVLRILTVKARSGLLTAVPADTEN